MVSSLGQVLFLDFDGVLHPDAVYLSKNGPTLKVEGELFMWAPHLVQLLEAFPNVSLVLSTSWVRHLGFKRASRYLPPELSDKVVGSTWHSSMARDWPDGAQWDGRTRYHQISRYAARAQLQHWVAIDDDTEGWPSEAGMHLIPCEPDQGLGNPATINALRKRLEGMTGRGSISN